MTVYRSNRAHGRGKDQEPLLQFLRSGSQPAPPARCQAGAELSAGCRADNKAANGTIKLSNPKITGASLRFRITFAVRFLWKTTGGPRIGGLKRLTPQHSLDNHSGDAGEGCFAKRTAQKSAGASRLSTSARSTQ